MHLLSVEFECYVSQSTLRIYICEVVYGSVDKGYTFKIYAKYSMTKKTQVTNSELPFDKVLLSWS